MTPPFHDRDGFIWMDGTMVPWREAEVHVLTHGLHYASSVFEGERSYQGKIFESEWHTRRLFASAETLGMRIPFSQQEILDAKETILKANHLNNAYIRPVVFRGSEQMGVSAPKTSTRIVIAGWEWPSYYSADQQEQGVGLMSTPWRKPDPRTAPTHSKAAALYAIGTLAKNEAELNGYQDCLMCDYKGFVAEATAANIFFVRNGALHTPDPHCFLNGITRQTVIRLANELGIDVIIRDDIRPEEVSSFDECFLTGTAVEITPVGHVDQKVRFTVGPVTRAIRNAYAQAAGIPAR